MIQTSTCLNRCFNVSLKSLKKARCSGKSGTSTKNRVRLSRKAAASCSQEPCTSCVSHEAAPNRDLNSAKVCASKASGTGLPSLNSNGTRISYRRNELIGGGTDHRELDSLLGQETQGLSRHSRFTRSPTLA